MNTQREKKVIPNFRALYSKRKRVSVRKDVKVVFLPGRVLVKIRVKDRKERREQWAGVSLFEEVQSKKLDVYKF